MADSNNSGQFGPDRKDTVTQASKGGSVSPGQFGGPQGADPSEAAQKQSHAAKVEGGKHSHDGRNE